MESHENLIHKGRPDKKEGRIAPTSRENVFAINTTTFIHKSIKAG